MGGGKKNNGAQPGRGWHDRWRLPLALALAVASGASQADAAVWHFHPRVDFAEIYTDNVSLASSNQQSDLVTEVAPGFSLNGESSRAKLNLNYRFQNLFYANKGDYGSNHQLDANGNVEVAREFFFVDARSTITQQIINPNINLPLDTINTGNLANVITYGVSPYFKVHAGQYADGEVRYSADQVVDESAAASNALLTSYSTRLNNDRTFSRFNWGLNFLHQDMTRSDAFDTHIESTSAVTRYRLMQSFNALARGGYENDQVPTMIIRNGGYWAVGGEWIPNRYFTASATGGENYRDADISWQPTIRSHFHVGYRNRAVGLMPGDVWNADISHYTRRSTWRLSYLEETTNIQMLQLTSQQFFVLVDANGKLVIDPNTGLPLILANNVFALTNEEFIRKRAQGTVDWNRGRTDWLLAVFNERREYRFSGNSDDAVGVDATWTWRFKPRTSSILAASWQRLNLANTGADDNFWYVSLALSRAISTRATSSIELRHTQQDFVAGYSYDENRLMAQLSMRF